MHHFVFLSFLIVGILCLRLESSSAQMMAGDVEILSMELSGPGCPQGSVHPSLAPDGSALTVLYDNFVGEISPEDHFARVICDLRLKLRKPRAMTFAFASADFRGFVNLEAGARASQRVRLAGGFNEDGQRDVNLSQQTWIGPLTEPFYFSAVQPEEGLLAVGCKVRRAQTMIRLRVAITLRSKKTASATGQIAIDSFDGGMTQRYHLQWSRCSQP
ncbi:MAG: DUF4360 domain-containing protein [Bdellovibrionales bacterium]|jgi:hypothetical protein|nr:DUF4360 domain-containing protein [Bdellovibrionales bacterium]